MVFGVNCLKGAWHVSALAAYITSFMGFLILQKRNGLSNRIVPPGDKLDLFGTSPGKEGTFMIANDGGIKTAKTPSAVISSKGILENSAVVKDVMNGLQQVRSFIPDHFQQPERCCSPSPSR